MKRNIEQMAAYVQHQMEKKHAREAAQAAPPKKKKRSKRINLAPIPFPDLGGGHLKETTRKGIEANPEKIQALLEMKAPKSPKEVQSLAGRVAALNRFVSRSSDKCAPFFNILEGGKRFEWTSECEEAFEALKVHPSEPPILSSPSRGRH